MTRQDMLNKLYQTTNSLVSAEIIDEIFDYFENLENTKTQKINFEFKTEPSNFGYQVLAFKNDSFDVIIRNSDKRNNKKYKVQITEI